MSVDVSGIACVQSEGFPRACLIIDDELREAQSIELKDGRIEVGKPIHLTDDTFVGDALSLDGEGVAYGDGYFYVIGSHGHPRDRQHKLDPIEDADEIGARISASSKIIRIRDGESGPIVEVSTNLGSLIENDPVLMPFMDQRLDQNGVTVEGIAVRGGRLFAGFRGPSLDGGHAAILSGGLAGLFGDAPPDTRLDLLPLGAGRGVRDLVPFGKGFLVLAGPTDDVDGTYSVFWWSGTGLNVRLLGDLPTSADKDGKAPKPEAILPLDASQDRLRILTLFDGAKEGGPRAFELTAP